MRTPDEIRLEIIGLFLERKKWGVAKYQEKANYPQLEVYFQNPSPEKCNEISKEQGEFIYQQYQKFLNNILHQKIPSIKDTINQILQKNENYYRNAIINFKKEVYT